MRHLFVMGCPRSGTSALVNLLNLDPRVIIAFERFRKTCHSVEPFYFREEVFFNPARFETTQMVLDRYQKLRKRWQDEDVEIIGDKVPLYFQQLPRLAREFPEARFVFLLRDLVPVASSFNVRAENPEDGYWPSDVDYRVALTQWNESLCSLREFVDEHGDERVFIVNYERFFPGEAGYLEALLRFIGLDTSEPIADAFGVNTERWGQKEREVVLSDAMLAHLDAGRDRDSEAWCLAAVERQLARGAGPPTSPASGRREALPVQPGVARRTAADTHPSSA